MPLHNASRVERFNQNVKTFLSNTLGYVYFKLMCAIDCGGIGCNQVAR
jgi:hypothetical protein